MAEIWDRLQTLWNDAKAGQSKTRMHFTLREEQGLNFEPRQHYFQIVVNEMFLATQRQWWKTYAPVALIATRYLYGKGLETSPMVVGPAMFREYTEDVPLGTIIRNTPVTSLHPYQGGPITLTVVLNRVQQSNNVDNVLKVLESFAGVINPISPAIPFSTYLKVAGSVMDGLEILLNLPQTVPLLAYRVTINPDIGDTFEPTNLVLIDLDEQDPSVNPALFTVRNSRLYYDGQPYRGNDFILIKIAQGTARTDERVLPFYTVYEETRALAIQAKDDHYWNETKAHFNTLKRLLANSADLTEPDYETYETRYFEEIKKLRLKAVGQAFQAGGTVEMPAEEIRMRRIAEELDALDKP